MSWRNDIAQKLIALALQLSDDINSNLTAQIRQADYELAIRTVQSIFKYVKQDADKYEDITPAVLEFSLLNELEKEIAFFYLLGQCMEVIGDGQ